MGWFIEIINSLLLFGLVVGMSATVDVRHIQKQVMNKTAWLIGIGMQFVILPFCGFLVVKAFDYPAVTGITLLVLTSSPGGSYSNWWCSVFNAELALSVTMTAFSTVLSVVMLPLNLMLYTRFTYSSDVVQSLDWYALFLSIAIVITAITTGLLSSSHVARTATSAAEVKLFHRRANLVGNVAGVLLLMASLAISSLSTSSREEVDDDGQDRGTTTTEHDAALWEQDAKFYVGVAMPGILGVGFVTYLVTKVFPLEKPERVAVTVESCYQNTAIATSVAINMFSSSSGPDVDSDGEIDDPLAHALTVPLYYGIVEAVLLAVYCVVCWKIGWTKAPPDENICAVLCQSYQEEALDDADQGGGGGDAVPGDCQNAEKQRAAGEHKADDTDFSASSADIELGASGSLESVGSDDPQNNIKGGDLELTSAAKEDGTGERVTLGSPRRNSNNNNSSSGRGHRHPYNVKDGKKHNGTVVTASDSDTAKGGGGAVSIDTMKRQLQQRQKQRQEQQGPACEPSERGDTETVTSSTSCSSSSSSSSASGDDNNNINANSKHDRRRRPSPPQQSEETGAPSNSSARSPPSAEGGDAGAGGGNNNADVSPDSRDQQQHKTTGERIGIALSVIRARATGYRKAYQNQDGSVGVGGAARCPDEDDDEKEDDGGGDDNNGEARASPAVRRPSRLRRASARMKASPMAAAAAAAVRSRLDSTPSPPPEIANASGGDDDDGINGEGAPRRSPRVRGRRLTIETEDAAAPTPSAPRSKSSYHVVPVNSPTNQGDGAADATAGAADGAEAVNASAIPAEGKTID